MANPNNFPIRLEQVFFTRQIVIAVSGYVLPKDGDSAKVLLPTNTITVHPVPQRPNAYAVTMQTIFNPEQDVSAPYSVDMECHAIFVAKEGTPEENVQTALTITGHSVVFGAIREAVYWMTGRQPYGPMPLGLSILQPVSPSSEENS
jgi:hypothetical protein